MWSTWALNYDFNCVQPMKLWRRLYSERENTKQLTILSVYDSENGSYDELDLLLWRVNLACAWTKKSPAEPSINCLWNSLIHSNSWDACLTLGKQPIARHQRYRTIAHVLAATLMYARVAQVGNVWVIHEEFHFPTKFFACCMMSSGGVIALA